MTTENFRTVVRLEKELIKAQRQKDNAQADRDAAISRLEIANEALNRLRDLLREAKIELKREL